MIENRAFSFEQYRDDVQRVVQSLRTLLPGIDFVMVERMNRFVRKPTFVERYFTPAEITYCETYGEYKAQPYGARWAGKEAVIKALGGIPKGNLVDVEILRDAEDVPRVHLHGAAKRRAKELGIEERDIHISLAHEQTIAAAVCVIPKKQEREDIDGY